MFSNINHIIFIGKKPKHFDNYFTISIMERDMQKHTFQWHFAVAKKNGKVGSLFLKKWYNFLLGGGDTLEIVRKNTDIKKTK